MFKTLITLFRGAAAAAEEEIVDRNALLILDQQIRDAAGAVERGKRALAIAVVQDDAERKRIESLSTRINDLEERAVAALAAGREDLAAEAAAAIAEMENDRAAVAKARASFADEIARLRSTVADFTRRLADLDRGRRIAMAGEAVRRLKAGHNPPGVVGTAALAEAEDTLRRLRERQTDAAAVDNVMQSLDPEAASATLIGRLEAAGCGPRTQTTAAEVLDRLRNRTKSTAASAN
ncbi:MAG TPA: PspA/IM30 family protein [Xanthobacteraceae bacterium]|nr:PspA/IM30 family protein [Xanthobacteraceae bacterium]